MQVTVQLTRAFSYNAWANRETLASLVALTTVPDRAQQVMGHIIGAEGHWLRRLGRDLVGLPVWPALSLSACEQRLEEVNNVWKSYVPSLASEPLDQHITYVNSKGEGWSNTVGDILAHVLFNSGFHRGQIAALLGQAGRMPAKPDYVDWVRNHEGDEDSPETS
jgi:uncharacterized damage-inducible protein DinB